MARDFYRMISELVTGYRLATTDDGQLSIQIDIAPEHADLWLDKISDLEASFEEILAYQGADFPDQPEVAKAESWQMVDELIDSYRFVRGEDGSARIDILVPNRFSSLWLWKLSTLTATRQEVAESESS